MFRNAWLKYEGWFEAYCGIHSNDTRKFAITVATIIVMLVVIFILEI